MNYTSRLRDTTSEMLMHRKADAVSGYFRVLMQGRSIDALVAEKGRDWPGLRDLQTWVDGRLTGESSRSKALVDRNDLSEFLPPAITRPIIELEESFSIVDRLPSPRAPFNVPVAIEDVAPVAFRLNQIGDHKPISSGSFSTRTLTRKPVAAMVVYSNELVRLAGPSGDGFRSRQLSRAVRKKTDQAFMASLIGSTTATPGTGTLALDIFELLRNYAGQIESAVLIMSSKNAIAASLSGSIAFQGLGRDGGMAAGLPAICSDSADDVVALVDSARVVIGDGKEMNLRVARHADIVMDNAASPAGDPVSMFQTNSQAVLAERYIDWAFGDGAVEFIEGVDYTQTGSPV